MTVQVSAETRPPVERLVQGEVHGVVLYDGQCGFCSRWVKFWAGTLGRRGFEIASLDEPWVTERLKMPHEELVTDIRLLTADGRLRTCLYGDEEVSFRDALRAGVPLAPLYASALATKPREHALLQMKVGGLRALSEVGG